jgi:AraC-like DNA-binding protein
MEPLRIDFTSIGKEESFQDLAALLGTSPGSNFLKIPRLAGEGFISMCKLDPGLVVVLWDLNLKRSVSFYKHPLLPGLAGKSFVLNFLLRSDDIIMSSPSLKRSLNLRGNLNVLFMTDDTNLEFQVNPGVRVSIASIFVTAPWLMKEFARLEGSFVQFLERIVHEKKPIVMMESSTPEEFRILSDVMDHSKNFSQDQLHIKPRIMTLVADFFSKMSQRPAAEVLESRIMHHEKIMEVENILKAHLEKELPSIDNIARTVTLSVSTLKRNFKIFFGKAIYEHYLEMRMEHAKRLLMEKDMSVNQVASRLNYEKVSSFIETFKKHQGLSPGSIKRIV